MSELNNKLFVALSGVIVAILIALATKAPPGDFANYYYGSKFLKEGTFTKDVYEPYKFNLAVYNEGLRNFFLNYTPVPPITSLLYLPFTIFSLTTAKVVWNLLNALLWLWLMYRLHKFFKIPAFYTFIVTCILILPLKSNFQQGQMYVLLTLLLVEGLIATEAKRSFWGGLLFALAILLKVFPAIVLGYLVFGRNWKVTTLTLVSLVGLVLISMVVIQPGIWEHYLVNVLPRLAAGEINNTYTSTYQSFSVLAKNLLVYDKLHNPVPVFQAPHLFRPVDLAFKIVVLICLAGISYTKTSSASKFALWLFGGMLVSGYGSSYGMVELVVILLVISELRNRWLIGALIFLLFAGAVVPINHFANLPTLLRFPRLLCFILMFMLLMVHFKPVIKPIWAIAGIGLIAVAWYGSKPDYPYHLYEQYLLEKEQHLLIYDFSISGNQVTYNYFDATGPGEESIKLPFTAEILEEIDMKRVDYLTPSGEGGRGVAGGENTPKAVIIDKKSVIYLSDANRGVGFYTLKIMGFKYMAVY